MPGPHGSAAPAEVAPARLYQTTFRTAAQEEPPVPKLAPKPERSGLHAMVKALIEHRWLISGMLLAGGSLGFLYSSQFCVPLYRIEASLEVHNSQPGNFTETLSHVLESQTLIGTALESLTETERNAIVEKPRLPFLSKGNSTEQVRARLKALATPSADVIDILFISPNRHAATDFVDALVRGLMSRNDLLKKTEPSGLPDEWNSDSSDAVDSIIVIDPAIASADPVAPNDFVNVAWGTLGGLMAGCVFALAHKFAVNTFREPGSVGHVLGVRELGAIPERKLLTAGRSDASEAAVQIDSNDESLRYLRSSLLYHPGKQVVRSLAFTSAAPGEGKTTVVSNLSMSLAATGRRVLIIDGDLRRPRLHKLMQVAPAPGLSDLLRRDPAGPPATLSKFVVPTSFQNLYVLAPGSAGQDAPELLAGPLLPKLIQELGKSFDFVLIDTPPLLACSDARNFARAVEGVVLVVRSSETQKKAALVARDMLLQDGANIIGTVLTGWRQSYPAYNYPSASSASRS
jgi:capsular exopolysaccharide synthesis family protein